VEIASITGAFQALDLLRRPPSRPVARPAPENGSAKLSPVH
jgi:hypothetical protein